MWYVNSLIYSYGLFNSGSLILMHSFPLLPRLNVQSLSDVFNARAY
jgi:hypothetical protein